MLIIPELETVVITPPRTGSTSLRDAVRKEYRYAFSPYRHMERDGIPAPYRGFRVLGTFRAPVDRLRSLHRYMAAVSKERNPFAPKHWITRMNMQGATAFEDVLLYSQEPFSDPYDDSGNLKPHYATMRPIPIMRKPQMDYLRPDMGPVQLGPVRAVADALSVDLPHLNRTDPATEPALSHEARMHMHCWHSADQEVGSCMINARHLNEYDPTTLYCLDGELAYTPRYTYQGDV